MACHCCRQPPHVRAEGHVCVCVCMCCVHTLLLQRSAAISEHLYSRSCMYCRLSMCRAGAHQVSQRYTAERGTGTPVLPCPPMTSPTHRGRAATMCTTPPPCQHHKGAQPPSAAATLTHICPTAAAKRTQLTSCAAFQLQWDRTCHSSFCEDAQDVLISVQEHSAPRGNYRQRKGESAGCFTAWPLLVVAAVTESR